MPPHESPRSDDEPPMTTDAPPETSARFVRSIPALLGLAALLVLAATAGFLWSPAAVTRAPAALAALQDLSRSAQPARAGEVAALDRVAASAARLRELAAFAPAEGWASAGELAPLFAAADRLLASRPALAEAGLAAREARELAGPVLADLQARAPVAAAPLGPGSSAPAAPAEPVELPMLRLQADLAVVAQGAADSGVAAQRLTASLELLRSAVGVEGAPESFTKFEAAVGQLLTAAPALPAAARSASEIETSAAARAQRAAAAAAAPTPRPWWPAIPALLSLVPLAMLLRRAGSLRADAEKHRLAAARQLEATDRNQQAILRLLDELSNLADGDLTVQATVTEDVTGAIADSINYAIEALRGLVTTINQTTLQLDGAARQTTALAQHLAKASSAQSKQIGAATESVAEMAAFTEEVSGNAERAADVARHSVDVAHKGGDAVRRTIDGMNTIRETIQDTSKRIKRLGESSQEIGNIVELINDIAEQTNILALNASIQASMAGEAGRGFAVVADEVQRLAERAANATKQIEALVRTIQADTNEAVVSMERSTTDVVGGALLAENAGAALGEIESVSNQIASLVQNISGSSRQQAQAAQSIARNMQVLREISLQTADSTSATSQSIGKLAELSADLRKSVSGFRLPGASNGDRAAPPSPFAGLGEP
jgi:twitching motility protein PilJ